MLRLITGQPGAGKTLNTIKFINENCDGRSVYYYGIKDIDAAKLNGEWIELDKEQLLHWYDLPDGSVLLIDEAQYIYPTRNPRSEIPKEVIEWSTHRHKGFDGFVITQASTLVDSALRKFVNEHWHFSRPYNANSTKKYIFQDVKTNPDDYFSKKDAEMKKVKLDKKYFDLYHSTTYNTHQFKVPKKLITVLVATVLCVAGVLWFVVSFADRKADDIAEVSPVSPSTINTASLFGSNPVPQTVEEYADSLKPRVRGLAYTAPFYDELTVPKSFPKPNCIKRTSNNDCQCYSQQATKLAVPQELCLTIVENGWFDFTKEEKTEEEPPTDPFAHRVSADPQRRTGLLRVVEHHQPQRQLSRDSRVQKVLRERARG